MSEVLITRKSQQGVPPDGFTQPTQILTKSGTWTCPRSGTYRVTCIGSGGLASRTPDVYMICGGGGGGIAESQLKLIKDSAITITVDSAISSFGNYLSASAGGTGFDSVYVTYAGGGAGGSASGGNIGNYTGGAGAVASSYYGSDSFGDHDEVEVIKCGGDTSKESKYGGAIGAMASRYPGTSTGQTIYGFINPITNGYPCFGAGQAIYGKYAVAGNNMGSGAIIIEYLK